MNLVPMYGTYCAIVCWIRQIGDREGVELATFEGTVFILQQSNFGFQLVDHFFILDFTLDCGSILLNHLFLVLQ